jgi:aconitase A
VPVLVDLASMRNAMCELGGDPDKINPMVLNHFLVYC